MGIIGFFATRTCDTEESVQPVPRGALDLRRVATQPHARLGALPVYRRGLAGRRVARRLWHSCG